MTTRTMFDALYLPVPTPQGYAVAAGYVKSVGMSHWWSADDWHVARDAGARYALPIAGGSLYASHIGDPGADALDALAHAPAGYPKGVGFALDVEHDRAQLAHDTNYAWRWAHRMVDAGAVPLIYCSATDAHLFAGLNVWVARWNNVAELAAGSVATQYASPASKPGLRVDQSLIEATFPLWDTRPSHTIGGSEPMLYPSKSQPIANRFRGAVIDHAARSMTARGDAAISPPLDPLEAASPWLGSYATTDDAEGHTRFVIVVDPAGADDNDTYTHTVI